MWYTSSQLQAVKQNWHVKRKRNNVTVECQCSRCRIYPNRTNELSFSSLYWVLSASQNSSENACPKDDGGLTLEVPFRLQGTSGAAQLGSCFYNTRKCTKWRKLFIQTDETSLHQQHNSVLVLVLYTQSCDVGNQLTVTSNSILHYCQSICNATRQKVICFCDQLWQALRGATAFRPWEKL